MFNSVDYRVEFSTGRVIKQKLALTTGLTAIFGRNGSGKSVSLDMIRFALFGAAALRGTNADYKRVDCTLVFHAKGVKYKINRTLKNAVFEICHPGHDEVIATGTTPINMKVVEILGFGLAVFDVSCAANQDDLNALSKMKPTERKRLIDSVIGIGALETVADWTGKEAALRNKEAEGLRSALTQPVEPTKPQDYKPSAELRLEVLELQGQFSEAERLRGWLQIAKAVPQMPYCDVEEIADDLQQKATEQAAIRRSVRKLREELNSLPQDAMTDEELGVMQIAVDAFTAYEAAQAWLRVNPKPEHCETKLKFWTDAWGVLDNNTTRAEIEKRIEAAKKGTLTCTECGHENHLHQSLIDQLETQLAALPPHVEIETPPLNGGQINRLQAQWKAFARIADEHARRSTIPAVSRPSMTGTELAAARRQRQAMDRRPAVLEALLEAEAGLSTVDYDARLARRRAFDASLANYNREKADYDAWVVERAEKQHKLLEFEGVAQRLELEQTRLAQARAYEQLSSAYATQKATYDAHIARAEALEAAAKEFKSSKAALTNLRAEVKQYLLPSLAVASSRLLADMTGNQLTGIAIDDDFNIKVNGQNIDTLSGSERAVANLSLRLGLGQVLTNGTLSVFLADEIDASMDDVRVEQTSNTLRAATKRIAQMIIVSHKEIEADQSYDLTSYPVPAQT